MLVSWSTTTRSRSVTARSLDFSLWTVYYVMKSILPNKKIMIDDKWLERSWGIGHETRGYFLLLSIPSSPPSPPSPFGTSSTPLEGNRHKAINFVVWEVSNLLPSFPSLPSRQETKRFDNSFMALFFLQPIPLERGIARWNAFIKCNVK